MTKLIFVCHGNICRSPMAEFIMKDMVKKRGCSDDFFIASAAVSNEEIGNPVHHGARDKLKSVGISCAGKRAVRLTRADYDKYDYIIGMDDWNMRNIMRIVGSDPKKKVHKLLEITDTNRDVDDPWYTGDFDTAYNDIVKGCKAWLELIMRGREI